MRVVTVTDVMREMCVTRAAVLRWIRLGYLPATKTASVWLIDADDYEQFKQTGWDEMRALRGKAAGRRCVNFQLQWPA